MKKLAVVTALLILLFSLPVSAADKNWNQFRGPNGDGTSTAIGLPTEMGPGKNVVWKTKIHGKGWS